MEAAILGAFGQADAQAIRCAPPGRCPRQFFNFFNHPVFDDPTVSLQAPATFGVIGAQTNYPPRVLQFGLHLDF
jgi:hypothetical protein